MQISPSVCPRKTNGWIIELHRDRVSAFHIDSKQHYKFDPISFFIWELCDGTNSYGEIKDRLSQEFPNSKSLVSDELSYLVQDLFSGNLLNFDGPMTAPMSFMTVHLPNLNPFSINYKNSLVALRMLARRHCLVLVDSEQQPDIVLYQGDLPNRIKKIESVLLQVTSDSSTNRCPEADYRLVFNDYDQELESQADSEDDMEIYLDSSKQYATMQECKDESIRLFDMIGGNEASTDETKSLVSSSKILTIAMATFDDYDGVFFSIESILMYHPEVRHQIEFLVLDNDPEGISSNALKSLARNIPEVTYVANASINGTAVRSMLFELAQTEFVLCMDCHVQIVPGALKALIAYYKEHPQSNDLLQGPLLTDNLDIGSTQMEPIWNKGMFGIWAKDKRLATQESKPFEIQMHGMGLFSCRRAAWPGFNPLFYGFGGEEGYIHQKFRNLGAKTLCLPSLGWLHRFQRPHGPRYNLSWEDRIRNYLIGFDEVGLSTEGVSKYFSSFLSDKIVRKVKELMILEKNNPFDFFDRIYFISSESDSKTWRQTQEQLEPLGLRFKVQRFKTSAQEPLPLSHQKIASQATIENLKHILVLSDGFEFPSNFREAITLAILEMRGLNWQVSHFHSLKESIQIEGMETLRAIKKLNSATYPSAVAYSSNCFSRLATELPSTDTEAKRWLTKNGSLKQFLDHNFRQLVVDYDLQSLEGT